MMAVGSLAGTRRQRAIIAAAAVVGGVLLAVIATSAWSGFGDSHAYWLAGRAVLEGRSPYEATTGPVVPYAYHYPPPLAQLAAPITAVVAAWPWEWLWIVSMVCCVLWLASFRPILALALVAYVPVALELGVRNVHLQLAVLTVLAIRRWPALFGIAATIKLSPAIGIVYLAASRRWRDAILTGAVLALICTVSFVVAPRLWHDFAGTLLARGPADVSGLLPVPYVIRLGAGVAIAAIAGIRGGRAGEVMVFIAIGIALPTMWLTAYSFFAGLVLLAAARPTSPGEGRS